MDDLISQITRRARKKATRWLLWQIAPVVLAVAVIVTLLLVLL